MFGDPYCDVTPPTKWILGRDFLIKSWNIYQKYKKSYAKLISDLKKDNYLSTYSIEKHIKNIGRARIYTLIGMRVVFNVPILRDKEREFLEDIYDKLTDMEKNRLKELVEQKFEIYIDEIDEDNFKKIFDNITEIAIEERLENLIELISFAKSVFWNYLYKEVVDEEFSLNNNGEDSFSWDGVKRCLVKLKVVSTEEEAEKLLIANGYDKETIDYTFCQDCSKIEEKLRVDIYELAACLDEIFKEESLFTLCEAYHYKYFWEICTEEDSSFEDLEYDFKNLLR